MRFLLVTSHLGFALSSKYNYLPAFIRERLVRPLVTPERSDGHYTIIMKRFVRELASKKENGILVF